MSRHYNYKVAEKYTPSEQCFQFNCLAGVSGREGGESLCVWALFYRKDIPQSLIDEHLDKGSDFDLAYRLTQWEAYSNGVGRWFGSDPSCIIGRNHILVRQFRAMDI